jgi:hypothetical protein
MTATHNVKVLALQSCKTPLLGTCSALPAFFLRVPGKTDTLSREQEQAKDARSYNTSDANDEHPSERIHAGRTA